MDRYGDALPGFDEVPSEDYYGVHLLACWVFYCLSMGFSAFSDIFLGTFLCLNMYLGQFDPSIFHLLKCLGVQYEGCVLFFSINMFFTEVKLRP